MTSYPFQAVSGPAEGPWPMPATVEYQCFVRGGAATAGDVYQGVRLQADDAGETFTAGSGNIGLSTHIMANVVPPTSTGILHTTAQPFFGVAVRGAADNALVRLCMFGYCTAFVKDTSASIAFGDGLTVNTTKEFDGGTGAANEIIIAQAQATVTTPTVRVLSEVLVNGIGGFCTGHLDASP